MSLITDKLKQRILNAAATTANDQKTRTGASPYGVPVNTGIAPTSRAVITPADPETETEGVEDDTDTEGLYNTPLDGSGLGQQPIGKSFMILGAAAVVGFFLLRKKKSGPRRKTARKPRRK